MAAASLNPMLFTIDVFVETTTVLLFLSMSMGHVFRFRILFRFGALLVVFQAVKSVYQYKHNYIA